MAGRANAFPLARAGPGRGVIWPNQTCLRPSLMTNWPKVRPHNTRKAKSVSEQKMWSLEEIGTKLFNLYFARKERKISEDSFLIFLQTVFISE